MKKINLFPLVACIGWIAMTVFAIVSPDINYRALFIVNSVLICLVLAILTFVKK